MKKYLPDFSDNEYREREFFYTILGTLFPKELEAIIKASRKHRALDETKDKNELIKITPEIYPCLNLVKSKWRQKFISTK